MTAPALVQKLPPSPWLGRASWNYSPSLGELRRASCNILRDDGLSYGDYDQQLMSLLFPRMAAEQSALLPKKQAQTSYRAP
jgi:hypothetical protein